MTCRTCRWYEPDPRGECRVRAPVLFQVLQTGEPRLVEGWPEVAAADYCGEYGEDVRKVRGSPRRLSCREQIRRQAEATSNSAEDT
mgnify:CR=1 FL=1